ncbi:meiotic recombination [Coemansia sp. RSA 2559]|nr:meiotic recombination [Coemansia sp. RSA 2559]
MPRAAAAASAAAARNSADDSSTLNILVATDNHLGFMERDPVRGDDSFYAFSEILQIAKAQKVDMVLLGGDLFHENKPTRRCMHRTMSLLRTHCLGASPVAIEYLSDPQVDFPPETQQHVNYEDPNVNVELPVFSIHGNHDDPSGDGNLSAMDMLAVSGLVNYFGRQAEIEHISVSPLLLRKGQTHLALYGLGNVRDERLHRTMARKRLVMCQPSEETGRWFNLMVLHQNRVPHGPKNHIPEHFLSDFLDLVVWGHEHQCQVDPEYNHQRSFYVTQPGSSVATALSSGESVPKHIAMLHINGKNFKLDKVRLKNVRPFVIEDVVLAQIAELSPQSAEAEIIDFLRRRVEAMIERAQQKYDQQLRDASADIDPALGLQPKPLVRIRVEYSGGFDTFHPQRFGLLFADRVANPRDMVFFYRKQHASRSAAAESSNSNAVATQETAASSVPAPMDAVHVESLISEFLDDANMQMLVDLELAEAVRQFVHKGDNDAIVQSLKESVNMTQKRILANNSVVNEDSLSTHIATAREQRRQRAIESGHGQVDSARDDAMVSVTLAPKRTAMNVADRQAIMAFEKIAAAAAAAKRIVPEATRGDSSDTESKSDNDDDEENEEFRNANIAKPNGRTISAAAAAAATNKKQPQLDLVSSSSSKKRELSTISRPSRNARSTLQPAIPPSNTASRQTSVQLDSDDDDNDNKIEEEESIDNSIPPTPLPDSKRQRATLTGAKKATTAAVPKPPRGRGSSKGRGRGRGRGSKSATPSSTSSQMPLINIDDDDEGDDNGGNRGFGRFSLRKR